MADSQMTNAHPENRGDRNPMRSRQLRNETQKKGEPKEKIKRKIQQASTVTDGEAG